MNQNPNGLPGPGPEDVEAPPQPSAPGDIVDVTGAAPAAETVDDTAPDKRWVVGQHAAAITSDYIDGLLQSESAAEAARAA